MNFNITVGEIKSKVSGIINVVTSLADSYYPTQEDFDNGLIGPMFKHSSNVMLIRDGFIIEGNKLGIRYVEVDSIKVKTVHLSNKPCDVSVKGDVRFKIEKAYLNSSEEPSDVRQYVVLEPPLIVEMEDKVTWARPNGGNVIVVSENDSRTTRSCNFKGCYYFKGVKYESNSTMLVQETTDKEKWVLTSTEMQDLRLIASTYTIPYSGGSTHINVIGEYVKHFELVGLNGDVIETKDEVSVKDVTSLCKITMDDYLNFKRTSNVISAGKQEIGATCRTCNVVSSFDGRESNTIVIKQEDGEQVEIINEFYFNDYEDEDIIRYEVSSNDNKKVLFPYTLQVVKTTSEWQTVEKHPEKLLLVCENCDWLELKKSRRELSFKATKPNLDKDNDRTFTVQCINEIDGKCITIVFVQKRNSVVKTWYEISRVLIPSYGYDELDNVEINIPVFECKEYDDGIISKEPKLPYGYSVCEENLNDYESAVRFGNTTLSDGFVTFGLIRGGMDKASDICITKKLTILNESKEAVSEQTPINIWIKGTHNPTYDYRFNFANAYADTVVLEWDERSIGAPQTVGVKSIKVPTEVEFQTRWINYKTHYESTEKVFLTHIEKDGSVTFTPIVPKDNYASVCTLAQEESGKRLTIILKVKTNKETTNIKVKVELCYTPCQERVVTSFGGNLSILDDKRIIYKKNLEGGWVTNESRVDTLLEFNATFLVGEEYHFLINDADVANERYNSIDTIKVEKDKNITVKIAHKP